MMMYKYRKNHKSIFHLQRLYSIPLERPVTWSFYNQIFKLIACFQILSI